MLKIDDIKKAVPIWAANLPFRCRIYLFGSYYKNTVNSCSDLDIGIEFLGDTPLHEDRVLFWMDNNKKWESDLNLLLPKPVAVHLNFYEKGTSTFLQDGFDILYESP